MIATVLLYVSKCRRHKITISRRDQHILNRSVLIRITGIDALNSSLKPENHPWKGTQAQENGENKNDRPTGGTLDGLPLTITSKINNPMHLYV